MKRVLFSRALAFALPLLLVACATGRPPVSAPHSPSPASVLAREGYVARLVDGRTVYCRTELATGTLFRTTVCRTEEQLAADEQAMQATAGDLRRTRGVDCSGRQGKCAR